MRSLLLLCLMTLVSLRSALAETFTSYPTKPIQLVVGLPAGTDPDIVARKLAAGLGEMLGQPVIVVNKPGVGGLLAMEQVANAPPDGYTIGLGFPANMAASPLLYQRPRYDVEKDLAPIGLIVRAPWVLYVSAQVPAKTMAEFIALAKAEPGRLTYVTTGIGGAQHLSMELLQTLTGTQLKHVPYGASNWVNDLLGGRVDTTIWGVGNLVEHVRNGKLRALAVSNGASRSDLLPDTPTFAEVGFAAFNVQTWVGLTASSGVPKEIQNKLATAMQKVVKTAAFRDFSAGRGMTAVGDTPHEFSKFLASERVLWKKVIADGNIRLE